ncbi:MAG: nicotinamide riboside transporter PnuC [Lachnospiraceae bacterium]|nr:nicotinamide riboside transporter PnuC [Lachnospiraceae bacterium]
MLKRLNDYFTTYEKIWFFGIMILAIVFAVLFPEEDINGVNGSIVMGFYLLDTVLNILCELLISKQSRWNFIVSLGVEVCEIAICVVCAYRFATMATTLFFWIPIDILSFITWSHHTDREDKELTVVRKLNGWAELAIIAGIIIWTAAVGGLLVRFSPDSDIFRGNDTIGKIVCYLDACVSAVAICNGIFILLRLREQWIAWYLNSIIEAAINILTGQWALLPLKLGFLINTTYGYIKWTGYIKTHDIKEELI